LLEKKNLCRGFATRFRPLLRLQERKDGSVLRGKGGGVRSKDDKEGENKAKVLRNQETNQRERGSFFSGQEADSEVFHSFMSKSAKTKQTREEKWDSDTSASRDQKRSGLNISSHTIMAARRDGGFIKKNPQRKEKPPLGGLRLRSGGKSWGGRQRKRKKKKIVNYEFEGNGGNRGGLSSTI